MNNVLKKEKYNIIEGKISEMIFKKDIINKKVNKNNLLSLNWWAGFNSNNYIIFYFNPSCDYNLRDEKISLKNDLYYEDIQVIKNLRKNNIEGFIVYWLDNNFYFFDIDKKEWLDKTKLIRKYNLKEHGHYDASNSKNETENQERKDTAIKYINNNMLIDKFKMERYFANYFLSSYFKYSYNIDAILYNKLNQSFEIYETKYKYPSKANFFGMNYGQASFFSYLLNNGFNNLYHYILYKNKNSKSYSIVNFINDNKKHKWYYKSINRNEIISRFNDVKKAPLETSITSQKKQKYIKFPVDDFEELII